MQFTRFKAGCENVNESPQPKNIVKKSVAPKFMVIRQETVVDLRTGKAANPKISVSYR